MQALDGGAVPFGDREAHPADARRASRFVGRARACGRSAIRTRGPPRHRQFRGFHPVPADRSGGGMGPGPRRRESMPIHAEVQGAAAGAVPDRRGVPPAGAGAERPGVERADIGARGGGDSPRDANRLSAQRDPGAALGRRASGRGGAAASSASGRRARPAPSSSICITNSMATRDRSPTRSPSMRTKADGPTCCVNGSDRDDAARSTVVRFRS